MKSIPPEEWPKWRAEQNRKDHNKAVLIAGIERVLDDGVILISKNLIRVYSHDDIETAELCIKQWAAEGILEILKPIHEAEEQENVIKMKKFIARASGSYPRNWPFKKEPISRE